MRSVYCSEGVSRAERKKNDEMITLITSDGRSCQQNENKSLSASSSREEYLMRCMFVHVRCAVKARRRDRWKDGQMRGDSSVCWWETPPLTSSSSVLNSNLFWGAAVIFAKKCLSLSFNSSLWFDIFYSRPGGEFFFPPALAGWASQCDCRGGRWLWSI